MVSSGETTNNDLFLCKFSFWYRVSVSIFSCSYTTGSALLLYMCISVFRYNSKEQISSIPYCVIQELIYSKERKFMNLKYTHHHIKWFAELKSSGSLQQLVCYLRFLTPHYHHPERNVHSKWYSNFGLNTLCFCWFVLMWALPL